MTGFVRGLVRDRDLGDATLKAVLEVVAWYATDDGDGACPCVETIADDIGRGRRTVRRALRKAEQDGLLILEKAERHHRARVYRIDLDVLFNYPLTATGERRLERQQRARQGGHHGRATRVQGGHPDHQGGHCDPLTKSNGGLGTGDSERARTRDSRPDPRQPSMLPTETNSTPTPATRATRLDPAWEPSAELIAFAEARGFSPAEIAEETSKFKDHFLAAPGQRGLKRDWNGTWRNWIRRAPGFEGHTNGRNRRDPLGGLTAGQAAVAGILGKGPVQ